MIKLTIYGRLRKFVGQSSFEIKANSPLQALSFLLNNYDGIREHMKNQEYCIMAGNLKITEDLLDLQTENDIKIIPVVHGEIFNLIVGGFLTFLGPGGLKFIGIKAIGKVALTAINAIGVSLLSQGIQELFAPEPTQFGDDPQDPNFIFTGLLNNSKQGGPINIIYGECLVGSTVVSSSVDSEHPVFSPPPQDSAP